jgi:hypothetical protein
VVTWLKVGSPVVSQQSVPPLQDVSGRCPTACGSSHNTLIQMITAAKASGLSHLTNTFFVWRVPTAGGAVHAGHLVCWPRECHVGRRVGTEVASLQSWYCVGRINKAGHAK